MTINKPVEIPASRTRRFRVLSLGAGVQSTCVYLMVMAGEIPTIDCAVFADTGDEPDEVYRHLDWLRGLGGPKIHIVKASETSLGDSLLKGQNSTGQSFASIPAFTAKDEGVKMGIVRRQCTSEYKLKPIERFVRRDMIGGKAGAHVPKNTHVTQLIGISLDEVKRAHQVIANNEHAWSSPEFPLLIAGMTRADCLAWMDARGFPRPPRSACVFCPYKRDREWLALKIGDSKGWARAVQIDEALRSPGVIVNRNLNQKLYLHDECRPLSEIDFEARIDAKTGDHVQLGFWSECQGMCGN